jgi:hypothetical protein
MRSGVLLVATISLLCTGRAEANGAFPDASQILVPADHPLQIAVGTNFGVVISDDEGATWTWTCEEVIGTFARLYQVGPPSADRIYALPSSGLVSSGDHACSWSQASGSFDVIDDAFPDPSDPTHVLAIAQGALDAGTGFYVAESHDGGLTFDSSPKYVPPTGYGLVTLEIAANAPMVVYTTLADSVGKHSFLGRSQDGGSNFQLFDIGTDGASIAAVDPNNPLRVFLRVQTAAGDALGISVDGATMQLALHLPVAMTAFLLRPDGTLLVAAANGAGMQSHDGGATWSPWATGLHIRALAERGGALYAAASDVSDGFAVGKSTDGGATWQPLLHLRDIQGPQACVWEACATAWTKLKAILGASSPTDGAVPDDLSVSYEPPPRAGGCSCNLADAASPGLALSLIIAAVLFARRLSRRS